MSYRTYAQSAIRHKNDSNDKLLPILRRAAGALRRGAAPVAATLLLAGCAAQQALPGLGAPLAPAAARAVAAFPAGPGREVLAAACTNCHDLGGIEPFRGYYDAARWRRLVDTMIAHGAKLDETEADVLVDYLVEHFGPGTR